MVQFLITLDWNAKPKFPSRFGGKRGRGLLKLSFPHWSLFFFMSTWIMTYKQMFRLISYRKKTIHAKEYFRGLRRQWSWSVSVSFCESQLNFVQSFLNFHFLRIAVPPFLPRFRLCFICVQRIKMRCQTVSRVPRWGEGGRDLESAIVQISYHLRLPWVVHSHPVETVLEEIVFWREFFCLSERPNCP